MVIGENGIITQAMYSKFVTEVKTIEEQIQMKQAISNSVYSGSINDLLEEDNKYNDKLLIEDNELKYISSAISSLELKWLEQLGIGKSSDYFTVEFDLANGNDIPSQTIRAGKQAKEPLKPTKTGYEFMGWYYLKEIGSEDELSYEEIEFNFNTKIVENYQLYAKYAGEAVMMARNINYAFWQETYRTKISSIKFEKGSIELPNNAVNWDIQADSNCAKITAYLQDDEMGGYILTVISPYTIYANFNCSYYFNDFFALKNIDFNNLDTSKSRTMKDMFRGCKNLYSLNLSNFETGNVINMNSMFYTCNSLSTLNVGNFNTENVTNMGGMFCHCDNLKSLDLSHFNTSKVISMGSMFSGCQNLETVNLDNFDTREVISMRAMFEGCTNLQRLNLNNFYTINVTDMYKMFYTCYELITLDLSNFDTRNVTNMAMMFYNCPALETIYASEKWTIEKVQENTYVFRYNTKLVGGNGTKYNSSNTGKEYACVDTVDTPGYFTKKTN